MTNTFPDQPDGTAKAAVAPAAIVPSPPLPLTGVGLPAWDVERAFPYELISEIVKSPSEEPDPAGGRVVCAALGLVVLAGLAVRIVVFGGLRILVTKELLAAGTVGILGMLAMLEGFGTLEEVETTA